MLIRNLTNIRTMLMQLTDLARLEAGQESVEVTDFDAGRRQVREGIGLHIVKRLCELIEATLEVETKEGRGTIFRIQLPIKFVDP